MIFLLLSVYFSVTSQLKRILYFHELQLDANLEDDVNPNSKAHLELRILSPITAEITKETMKLVSPLISNKFSIL